MNAVLLHLEIHLPPCCAAASAAPSPPDDLVERLRNEMRYGRGYDRRPALLPGVTVDMLAAFYHCPERN